ncbi:MAG: DUF3617 family protein [Magnetococcales bacterium]|nr:DUF3617 family protein [Magnetococcales bacterium]
MRRFAMLIAAAALLTGTTVRAAELDVKEGMYEVTIKTVMPGMPMPDQTVRDCVTAADRKDPQRIMKKGGGGDDCALKDYKQESNRISFAISCPKEQVNGKGEYRFSGDGYAGTMKMTMAAPGAPPMSMDVQTTAKWVGPCK